jgi:hypothetical protein
MIGITMKKFTKRLALAVSLILSVSMLSYGQGNTFKMQTAAQKPTDKDDKRAKLPPIAIGPVEPLEVEIGLHRTERAVFLTVKNLDTKRSINKVICSISVLDSLKVTEVNRYYALNFKFPLEIEPGKTGKSVLTHSDDVSVGPEWLPGFCKSYKAGEKDVFAPAECKGSDALVVFITRVNYTDGSEWASRNIVLP